MKLTKRQIEALVMLLLITAGLSLALFTEFPDLSVPRITGAAVTTIDFNVQKNPLQIEPIPEQNLNVGEPYKFEFSSDPDLKFYDNTLMFQISDRGVIEFTPTEKDRGRKTVVIIVENREGDFTAEMMVLNIE